MENGINDEADRLVSVDAAQLCAGFTGAYTAHTGHKRSPVAGWRRGEPLLISTGSSPLAIKDLPRDAESLRGGA